MAFDDCDCRDLSAPTPAGLRGCDRVSSQLTGLYFTGVFSFAMRRSGVRISLAPPVKQRDRRPFAPVLLCVAGRTQGKRYTQPMTYKAPTYLYSIIVHVYDGLVEKPAFVMETGLPLFDAIQIAKSLNIHQAGPGTLYGVQVEAAV